MMTSETSVIPECPGLAMRKAALQPDPAGKTYPFWDYRSRRGSMSTSSSGASDVSSISGFTLNMTRSDAGSDYGSEVDHHMAKRVNINSSKSKLSATLMCKPYHRHLLLDLYTPITNLLDPDMDVVDVVESPSAGNDIVRDGAACLLQVPNLAITVFLMEDDDIGQSVKVSEANEIFRREPWCFHHSENVSATKKLQVYSCNKQEYFLSSFALPLWGIRQVHCGKEHIRFTRFVNHYNWKSAIRFYETIVGHHADIIKPDFCLYTLHSWTGYDVQFALKCLPRNFNAHCSEAVILQFKTANVNDVTAKLSRSVTQVSNFVWETTDYDGNMIQLMQTNESSFSPLPMHSSSPIIRTDAFYV